MAIDLSQFYQVFFEEAAEHFAEMESLLLGLDVANPSMDDLNAIFRSAHSVKGGAGSFGFTDMTEVTHVLETLLDKLRKQEMTLTNEMVSAFLEAGDTISMQLAAHRGEGKVDESAVRAVREKLERLSSAPQSAITTSTPDKAETAPEAGERPAAAQPEDPGYGFFDDLPDTPASAQEGTDAADPGYGFFTAAEGSPRSGGAPTGGVNSASSSLDSRLPTFGVPLAGETPAMKAELEAKQGYGFFGDPPKPKPAVAAPIKAPQETTRRKNKAPASGTDGITFGKRVSDRMLAQAETTLIRVSVEKVDQLINLMGELVITQSMLAQAAAHIDGTADENLQRSLYQLERNTRDMQEAVMSIRMMPIFFAFNRFPRLVRELSGRLSKQVEIKMVGESTELDKGLIEKISDPLTHLVRNSLDHGIELPEKRIAAGKDPCGTLTLKASHQGGSIVIEVLDDGGGLNRGKILQKAKGRGLAVHDDMSDQDVWALIMEPGFSTAEVVTDVSGRGVGMDVVRRNISELGGRVELDSVEGYGTRVIIRLPLTLAILDGLSVSVGRETYIIPLNAIIESLPGAAADIKTVSGEGQLLRVRGEHLPIVALHKVFGVETKITEPERGILVLVEAESRKIALFVDELVGQHQVVIKSLESNYRRVPCVSGATIMGDGRVALILDVAALIRIK